MRSVSTDLPDLGFIDKRLAFKDGFVGCCLDIVIFPIVLNRNRPKGVSFETGLLGISDVYLTKIIDFSQNCTQILNCDLSCLITDKKHKLAISHTLVLFPMVIRVNSSYGWLFFDIFKVAPSQDQLSLCYFRLGQPNI
jgi:hypothetical protein